MKKFLQLSMILALLANTALKAQADFALEFNGVDQRVKYSSDANLDQLNGAENYTIEAWVKPTTDVIHNKVVMKRWYQFALTLYKDDLKKVYLTLYGAPYDDGSGTIVQDRTYINTTDNVINIGEWNHIAVINDATANELKIYVNGVDVTLQHYDAMALISNPDDANSTYAPNLYIANGGSGTYLAGQMDDIRIVKEALNIADLNTSVNDPVYATNANTIVQFNFNEGSGVTTKNAATDTDVDLLGDPTWVDISNATSIAKNNITTFNVYPNPSTTKEFAIQANSNESILNVEIIDIMGKIVKTVVYSNNINSSKIDVHNLSSGVYFVKIKTDKGIGTQKVIVK